MKSSDDAVERDSYAPNAPIVFGDVPTRIAIGEQTIEVATRAVLNLLPEPRLEFSFIEPYAAWSSFEDVPSITLMPSGRTVEVFATASISEKGTIARFVAHRQPCTVSARTRRRIRALRFAVLNFPPFYGNQDRLIKFGTHGQRRLGAA